MALVLNWQKKLGYRSDPFVDRPFYKGLLIDLEPLRRRINLFLIKNERFGVIKGSEGSGKTTLVNWLKHELRHRKMRVFVINPREFTSREKLFFHLFNLSLTFTEKRVARIDQKRSQEEKEQLLIERLNENNYLFLVDNAGSLLSAHQNLIDDLLEKTKAKILLIDEINKLAKLAFVAQPTLRETIRKYNEKHLRLLLHERLKSVSGIGFFPFDDTSLKKVLANSNGNPRDLLAAARERAIELSLKVKGPPQKPKRQKKPGEWSVNLFGKDIRIPMPDKKPGKPGKPGTHKPKKKWGFLSIEFDEKEHEDALKIVPEPGERARGPKPEKGVKMAPAHHAHVPKSAAADAEQLAELMDNSDVEIEIEEKPVHKKEKKDKSEDLEITEEMIADIAKDLK